VIWGTEAIHSWFPAGEEIAAAALNERFDSSGDPLFPRVKIREIGGLFGLSDGTDLVDAPTNRDGETPRRSRRRGKTITYEGLVEALSVPSWQQYAADLRSAFFGLTDGRMQAALHTLNPNDASLARYYDGRAITLEIGDPIELASKVAGTFLLAVRNHRGLYYDSLESDVSLTITNSDTTYSSWA